MRWNQDIPRHVLEEQDLLRARVNDLQHENRDLRNKLAAIEALEVHGREFVDAAELYRILDKPIPPPIDHAANIRARAQQGPR